jgi:hypothetical protein
LAAAGVASRRDARAPAADRLTPATNVRTSIKRLFVAEVRQFLGDRPDTQGGPFRLEKRSFRQTATSPASPASRHGTRWRADARPDSLRVSPCAQVRGGGGGANIATSSARLRTPSFRNIRRASVPTVLIETPSVRAMSGRDMPCTIASAMRCSLAESLALVPTGRSTWPFQPSTDPATDSMTGNGGASGATGSRRTLMACGFRGEPLPESSCARRRSATRCRKSTSARILRATSIASPSARSAIPQNQ